MTSVKPRFTFFVFKPGQRGGREAASIARRGQFACRLRPQDPCLGLQTCNNRVELQLEGPVQQPSGFVIGFFDIEGAFGTVMA